MVVRIGVFKSASRYGVVGVASTILQYGVLTFLVENMHVSPKFASMAGFIIGCMFHYILLYYWTFQSSTRHREVVIRYLIVTLTTFWMNMAIFSFLLDLFSFPYLLAQSSATLGVAIVNYLINRTYTFS